MRFRSNYWDPCSCNNGFLALWTHSNGCNDCDFPFTFAGTTFDTCISIKDEDTVPWCTYDDAGTEIAPVKIPCSDTDSSCPSTPPQIVNIITSLDYPQSYPNNADQVK